MPQLSKGRGLQSPPKFVKRVGLNIDIGPHLGWTSHSLKVRWGLGMEKQRFV